MLALAELVGLIALMVASGALLCWGIDELIMPPPPPRRKRKRQTCPARIVNGKKR